MGSRARKMERRGMGIGTCLLQWSLLVLRRKVGFESRRVVARAMAAATKEMAEVHVSVLLGSCSPSADVAQSSFPFIY